MAPSPTHALQPLETFLERGRDFNPQGRIADAQAEQSEARIRTARSRILPSLSLSGVFTHNQFDAIADIPTGDGGTTEVVIVPKNQLDGFATLEVPLIDLAGIYSHKASKKSARAARYSETSTLLDVERQVVRLYYELLGAEALVQSAKQNLEVAQENTETVRAQKAEGTGSEFDLQQAEANQAQAERLFAESKLRRNLSRRELYNVTGLNPEPVKTFPAEDTSTPRELNYWQSRIDGTVPAILAADALTDAARIQRRAAKASWAPILTAAGQERVTNATGFQGEAFAYTISATLSWRLDAALLAEQDAQRAAAMSAEAQGLQNRIDAKADVFEAWHRVKAGINMVRAAIREAEAARKTARLSFERYRNGVDTQLDFLRQQRNAFTAQVTRIRAAIDLEFARKQLRIATGQSLIGTKGRQ